MVDRMRICLVYDCLFPHTVGGAERWYRNLAERLAREGHEVTYLTLRQWERGDQPSIPGVELVAVAPRMELYVVGRARRYDVVHPASFPYFSLLAAAAARRLGGYRLVVDWHELWPRDYWL